MSSDKKQNTFRTEMTEILVAKKKYKKTLKNFQNSTPNKLSIHLCPKMKNFQLFLPLKKIKSNDGTI